MTTYYIVKDKNTQEVIEVFADGFQAHHFAKVGGYIVITCQG